MSVPSRQRSLRERIQSASRGIGISWQGKKSKSYHSKESLTEAQSDADSESGGGGKEEACSEKQQKEEKGGSNSETNKEHSSPPKEEGSGGTEKKVLGRSMTQPQGTEQYKVVDADTLAGIAARYDTTPSELAKLNRLSARIVFPGQLLFVPEKKNKDSETVEGTDSLLPPQNEERRPSVTDSLRIPYRRSSERAHRFLKVKARHFTDGQGVVAGVLIITPNAVMFDPNVSDPLVMEHGVESYGVIAPLDMLMRSAIYFDIAHMKVQHAGLEETPRPKVDVYFGKMTEEALAYEEEMRRNSSQEKTPPPSAKEETPQQESSPPPIQEPEPVETSAPEPVENSAPTIGDSVDSFDEEVSDAFAVAESQEKQQLCESRKERVLKRLSYPMESITSFSRILTSSPKSFVDFSGSLFSGKDKAGEEEEEGEGGAQVDEGAAESTARYQNLVDEKPEIFEALDKLLSERRGEETTEGPPLYLCLRMGIPKERKPQPSPVLSYGKKKARSEYWFSIPRSRVEDLYSFLQQWIPHLYGDVDDVDPDEAGFTTIDDSLFDEEEEEDEEKDEEDGEGGGEKEAPRSFLKLVEEHFGFKSGISPGDWEVLSLGDMEKVDYSDFELPLPDLLATSEIFQEEHIKELYTLLPARAVGYPWTRIFSTSTDGFHLKTLYRKMTEFDSPVILAIQDTEGAIFGALLSYPLRPSDSFYGTGESFLFTFHPSFKMFKWTGENDYFVKGNMDSLSVGASEGHFGLWMDGDLYRGRSVRCQTYDNDTLASSSDFIIKTLEAWGFA